MSMHTEKTILALGTLFVAATAPLTAQLLEHRHQVALQLGVWNQVNDVRTDIGIGGISTSVGSSGFLGGVAYGYGLSEGIALRVSAGAMAARIETQIDGSGVASETAAVTELMVGMRYYFPRSTWGSSVRPYVGAGVGTFIGSQVASQVGSVVTAAVRTEAAMGGELGAGVDLLLGRHFVTSVGLGYALMTDFDQPIGGSDNYSGPQLRLGFGYVFGSGMGSNIQ
jgi:outer membrane protein W